MTKEEKIREAYSEHYDLIKNHIDDNGWVLDIYCGKSHSLKVLDCEWKSSSYCRPKSIQGIENNNKWIKIESEDDLPEQGGSYYVTRCDKVETAVYVKDNRWLVKGNDYPKTTILHSITHYQPIQKPQPPIY